MEKKGLSLVAIGGKKLVEMGCCNFLGDGEERFFGAKVLKGSMADFPVVDGSI